MTLGCTCATLLSGRTTCAVQIALGAIQWQLQLSFTPHPSDEIQTH